MSREADVRWQDTDHGQHLSVDLDRAAHDVRILAVPLPPEPKAQDGHGWRAGSVVVGVEQTTVQGRDLQNPEEVGRDGVYGYLLRHPFAIREAARARGPQADGIHLPGQSPAKGRGVVDGESGWLAGPHVEDADGSDALRLGHG